MMSSPHLIPQPCCLRRTQHLNHAVFAAPNLKATDAQMAAEQAAAADAAVASAALASAAAASVSAAAAAAAAVPPPRRRMSESIRAVRTAEDRAAAAERRMAAAQERMQQLEDVETFRMAKEAEDDASAAEQRAADAEAKMVEMERKLQEKLTSMAANGTLFSFVLGFPSRFKFRSHHLALTLCDRRNKERSGVVCPRMRDLCTLKVGHGCDKGEQPFPPAHMWLQKLTRSLDVKHNHKSKRYRLLSIRGS
jgi:hypothetical protein